MLATFAHTGGLTGVEVGLAAATAVLNQKLLEALFGEAAMVEMVNRARRNLDDALAETWEHELGRYRAIVPAGEELRDLATNLRAGASEVRELRPMLAADAVPMLSGEPAPGELPAPLAAATPEPASMAEPAIHRPDR